MFFGKEGDIFIYSVSYFLFLDVGEHTCFQFIITFCMFDHDICWDLLEMMEFEIWPFPLKVHNTDAIKTLKLHLRGFGIPHHTFPQNLEINLWATELMWTDVFVRIGFSVCDCGIPGGRDRQRRGAHSLVSDRSERCSWSADASALQESAHTYPQPHKQDIVKFKAIHFERYVMTHLIRIKMQR